MRHPRWIMHTLPVDMTLIPRQHASWWVHVDPLSKAKTTHGIWRYPITSKTITCSTDIVFCLGQMEYVPTSYYFLYT